MSEEVVKDGQENRQADEQAPSASPETPALADESLQQRAADLENQIVQLKDQLLRKAAEFDNYKRRTENDFAALARFAAENTLTQLLPVLDDFDRSLKNGKEKLGEDSFYKGVEMIQQKFFKVLESQGLTVMETKGKEFNVDFHDALMQMPRADVPAHTVIEEVEKGYLLFDKVIRHAKVIVSAEAPSAEGKKE
ncbi:MAG: nucleotide exchange factor GrpE [Ignavibacteriales bacterium]|nr:nucleotide exchange factor GrpE [Ignavibacteriales bacterium]